MTEQVLSTSPQQAPNSMQQQWDQLAQLQVPAAVHAQSVEAAPAAPGMPNDDDADWGYTGNGQEIARLRQDAERRAGRQVRHTIGRDSSINQGVYEGSYGGEAIVVDYDKYPEGIQRAVQTITATTSGATWRNADRLPALKSIFSVVDSTMRYDKKAVDQMFQLRLGGVDGTKIALEDYIDEGFGVCRHQALYAGAITESLQRKGYIDGQVSVDRNMVRRSEDKDDAYDGHAWMRYTDRDGKVFILDVAQGRVDSLDNLMAEREANPKAVWDYARPEDKIAYAARKAAQDPIVKQETVVEQVSQAAAKAEQKKRRLFGRRAGKSALAQEVVVDRLEPLLARNFEGSSNDLKAIIESLPVDGRVHQKPGKDNGETTAYTGYTTSMAEQPISRIVNPDGSSENLSHVLLAGDSAIAVVYKRSHDDRVSEIRLQVLPFGTKQQAATLESAHVTFPNSALDTGVRVMDVGRGEKSKLAINDDSTLSSKHFNVIAKGGRGPGTISFVDTGSTNGLVVLDAAALHGSKKQLLKTFGQQLESNPALWQKQTA